MKRYLRLYLHFLRFSFSRALQFRLDFFFRIVMDCVFYLVNLAFFAVLYRHIESLGGLTEDDIYVFVAGYLFLDAIHMTVFSNNMWYLPQLINKGELDYYLVRPVSTLFFVSVREFAANSFLNLIIAAGILGWSIARHPTDFAASDVAVHVLLLLAGTFLYWVIHMLHVIPVFWLHQGEGLRNLFFGTGQFSERPHPIFTGWVGRILRTVIPYALLVSFPTFYFLGRGGPELVAQQLTVTAVFTGLMLLVWRRGLRAYSSASS